MPSKPSFTNLHQALIDHYNLEELRTLCAQLNIPFEDLGGEGRQAKARELILWLERRGRLDELSVLISLRYPATSEGQAPAVSEPGSLTFTLPTAVQPGIQQPRVVAGLSPDTVDLAIVTAMPEELEPVLQLIGGREHWRSFLLDKFVHYHSRFELDSLSLTVVACSLWKYGGNPTTAEVQRLKSLRPRLIAMTGICAGWESKGIHFGDVIVADRAFHAGEGKETTRGFEPDTRTYQPPPWLMQWLADFSTNRQWFGEIKAPRPHSLRYQAEWVLCQMEGRRTAYPEATDWRKIKANHIDFTNVKHVLLENGLITGAGLLTERAQATLDELRQKNHGKLAPIPDPKEPSAHYGAFASTEAVIAVENPFLEYAQRIRKVRAIELEVASLFAAAAEINVPAFAVKGVSDYGTPNKDDAFHRYAAEASARWMYAFIGKYAHHLLSD